MIVGFASSAASAFATDYLIDGSSYTLEKYEQQKVSDQEKEKSYLYACENIGVCPSSNKNKIKKEVTL